MLTVRTGAEPGELPALYQIEIECFSKPFRWSEKAFRRAVEAAVPAGNLWVADEDGRVLGYLLATESGAEARIETVNVAATARRRGIASRLVAACEKSFRRRGYKRVGLEVHTDNPAYLLYWSLGYRPSGFKRNYYSLGAHALTMTKPL